VTPVSIRPTVEDRRRLWSIGPGAPRPVRARYPRLGWHFGHTSQRMITGALVQLGVGALLLVLTHGLPQHADQTGAVVGTGLLLRGGYRLIRAQLDRRSPVTVTGTVLWLGVWRTRTTGRATPRKPSSYYLTVDSGLDRTVAWSLTPDQYRLCHVGDTVQLTAEPWSRRVTRLRTLKRARRPRPAPS
jgi:hypothetical protein